MELWQGIRKILNLMIYEAIGTSYKLVQWDLYNVDLEEWANFKKNEFHDTTRGLRG